MRFLKRLFSSASTGDSVPFETKPAPWAGGPYRLPAGATPVPVRFVISLSPYGRGEVAGFDEHTANALIDAGIAVEGDEPLDAPAEDAARLRREARREQQAARVGLLDRAKAMLDDLLTLSPEAEQAIDEAILTAEKEERAAWLRAQCLRHGGAYLPGVDD